ncbi:aspartate and glycine-rich protein-like [Ruditapes philippinarum]|uniref:aspartate and glycine-rich protein-like n=1 Tax=Ruditapes philippinarum TaxID=129788 RepID=UPI00295B6093|nr:aspartate and glycine-rich protein-like [Ruditapes philippinarum]
MVGMDGDETVYRRSPRDQPGLHRVSIGTDPYIAGVILEVYYSIEVYCDDYADEGDDKQKYVDCDDGDDDDDDCVDVGKLEYVDCDDDCIDDGDDEQKYVDCKDGDYVDDEKTNFYCNDDDDDDDEKTIFYCDDDDDDDAD